MELHLTFSKGNMTGEGRDKVGAFIVRGSYTLGDGKCHWTKRYVKKHDVFYQGFNEGKGIWGVWIIPPEGADPEYRGGFHIWPEGMSDPTDSRLAAELDLPTPVEHRVDVENPVEVPAGVEGESRIRSRSRRPQAVIRSRERCNTMTWLYSDPVFLKHVTGHHPENADRLRAESPARLEAARLIEQCKKGAFQPVADGVLLAAHSAEVVERAKSMAQHGGGSLDPDTVVSASSFDVARAAVGACTSAVDAVVDGPDRTALCLVRPPGHHATPDQSMGFCLFNNVALAAMHARKKHAIERVLIVDWDVHHGNGTQDIFYRSFAG